MDRVSIEFDLGECEKSSITDLQMAIYSRDIYFLESFDFKF